MSADALPVTALRDLARAAMLSCGARGFMRFVREEEAGDALLVSDAASRCQDGGAALREALARAGFICRQEGKLTRIAPGNTLLLRLCAPAGETVIDWKSPLHEAQAFAARLMREEDAPLTPSGRALIARLARLLWQPREKALAGLQGVRAMTAVRLRQGDRNGFYNAGCMLARWVQEQMEEELL